MIIYFDSRTENVAKFVAKLGEIYPNKDEFEAVRITKDMLIDREGHLITFTTGFGKVPMVTAAFLSRGENKKYIKSISSSGAKSWGELYGKAAKTISKKFDIPMLMIFELAGTEDDVKNYLEKIL